MQLLLINPNTSEDITDLVLRHARGFAAPETVIRGATGRFGARYVATRAAYAIAAHAALDAYAEQGADADAVILACFGDPGLFGLRELAHQPVLGLAEAACQAAVKHGGRFAIVTGGERWGPMLEEFVASIGLAQHCAGVTTVAPSGAEIASNPDAALGLLADACNNAIANYHADAVILGGAGLAGIAPRIAGRVRAPLIDPLQEGIREAERLAAAPPAKPSTGSYAPTTPVPTIGLSERLGRHMEGRA
jgi:Asp/Glu/hydantoin racemase